MSTDLIGPVYIFQGENPTERKTIDAAQAYYSQWLNTQPGSRGSFQCDWTGDITGTLEVQTTNDTSKADADGDTGSVTETGIVSPSNPSGSAGSTMIHFFENGAAWTRVRYTNDSGTGAMSIVANSKR